MAVCFSALKLKVMQLLYIYNVQSIQGQKLLWEGGSSATGMGAFTAFFWIGRMGFRIGERGVGGCSLEIPE